MGKRSYKKIKKGGGKKCSTDRPLCLKKPPGKPIEDNCVYNSNILGPSYEPIKYLEYLALISNKIFNNKEEDKVPKDGDYVATLEETIKERPREEEIDETDNKENCYNFDTAWRTVILDIETRIDQVKQFDITPDVIDSIIENVKPSSLDLKTIFLKIIALGKIRWFDGKFEENKDCSTSTTTECIGYELITGMEKLVNSAGFIGFCKITTEVFKKPAVLKDNTNVEDLQNNDDTKVDSLRHLNKLFKSTLAFMNPLEDISNSVDSVIEIKEKKPDENTSTPEAEEPVEENEESEDNEGSDENEEESDAPTDAKPEKILTKVEKIREHFDDLYNFFNSTEGGADASFGSVMSTIGNIAAFPFKFSWLIVGLIFSGQPKNILTKMFPNLLKTGNIGRYYKQDEVAYSNKPSWHESPAAEKARLAEMGFRNFVKLRRISRGSFFAF